MLECDISVLENKLPSTLLERVLKIGIRLIQDSSAMIAN